MSIKSRFTGINAGQAAFLQGVSIRELLDVKPAVAELSPFIRFYKKEAVMRILKSLLLTTVFLVLVTGTGHAGSVFLTDGGELECKSFRRQGNTFIVMVNRDTVLELSADEIDLKKTLAQKSTKKQRKPFKQMAASTGKKAAANSLTPASPPPQTSPLTRPAAAPLSSTATPQAPQPAVGNAKPAQAVPPPAVKGKTIPPEVLPAPAPKAAPPVAKPVPPPSKSVPALDSKDFLMPGLIGVLVLMLIVLAIIRKRRASSITGNGLAATAAKPVTASGKQGGAKKWQIALLTVLVAGGGTFAYVRDTPHYSLYLLKKAMNARDAETAVIYIDFESIIRNIDTNPLGDVITAIPKMPGMPSGSMQKSLQIKPEEAQKMAKTLTAMMAPMLAQGFRMEFENYVKSPEKSSNQILSKFRSGDVFDYSIDRNGKSAEVVKKDDQSIRLGMAKSGYGIWKIVKVSTPYHSRN